MKKKLKKLWNTYFGSCVIWFCLGVIFYACLLYTAFRYFENRLYDCGCRYEEECLDCSEEPY